ncbi:MAG: DUF4393 domain-containing protein [Minwuiales bacterium]|nr:DUF4393 domain-containing protein [Minwuiales bacterium]
MSNADQNESNGRSQLTASSLSQAAGQILLNIFGPSSDELGAIIAEDLRAWRWRRRNVENVTEKIDAEIRRRELDPEELAPLPEGDAYRATTACSLEDDELVQEMWAGLFTSAMDPNSNVSASKVFVEILKSIGAVEAGLLLVVHKIDTERVDPTGKSAQEMAAARKAMIENISEFCEKVWRRYLPTDQHNAIQNLMRLRCIGFRTGKQLNEDQLLRGVPLGVNRDEIPASAAAVAQFLDYVENLALAASGTGSIQNGPSGQFRNKEIPETLYQFTSLGRSLIQACVRDVDRLVPSD